MSVSQVESGGGWVSAHDLDRVVHGREEDPELAALCLDYVFNFHPRPAQAEAPDRRIIQALLSARVRRSIRVRDQSGEIARRLTEQEVRLERQASAIDHLLSFLPKREKALPDNRLEELRLALVSAAKAVVGKDVEVRVESERDPLTRGCHRFVVEVGDLGARETLGIEDQLTAWLFNAATAAESPSLSIEVVVR